VNYSGWTWPAGFVQQYGHTQSGWYTAIALKFASAESGAYTMGGTFAVSNAALHFLEYTDIKPTSPFDVGAVAATASGTTVACGPTATTAVPKSLALACAYWSAAVGTPAWDSGFTQVNFVSSRHLVSEKILPAIGPVSSTCTWTTARAVAEFIAVFKGA